MDNPGYTKENGKNGVTYADIKKKEWVVRDARSTQEDEPQIAANNALAWMADQNSEKAESESNRSSKPAKKRGRGRERRRAGAEEGNGTDQVVQKGDGVGGGKEEEEEGEGQGDAPPPSDPGGEVQQPPVWSVRSRKVKSILKKAVSSMCVSLSNSHALRHGQTYTITFVYPNMAVGLLQLKYGPAGQVKCN